MASLSENLLRLARIKILIVDKDHHYIRKVVRTMLERDWCPTHSAGSLGRHGRGGGRFPKFEPDRIMLDWDMPLRIDGLEFAPDGSDTWVTKSGCTNHNAHRA